MIYNPWRDAQERYPQFHIERLAIAPYRALLSPQESVIFVDAGGTKAQNRCGLAHEIAHLDAGDRSTDIQFFSDRQEVAADRTAARRLIPIGRLVDAHLWAHCEVEIAGECWVDAETLRCRLDSLTPAEYAAIQEAIAIRDYHEEGLTEETP